MKNNNNYVMIIDMKLLRLNLTSILLTLIVVSCGSQSDKNQELLTDKLEVQQEQVALTAESFNTFYERFINDESFQMTRIKFPLQGYSIEGDEKVQWTKDNFRVQRGSVFDVDTNKFKVKVTKTDTTIFTRIYKDDSEVDIQNKFELVNGKWFLIYYLNIY